MDLGLRDKRVLVTGATSGIGLATARRFAEEGARVAITYQSSDAKAKEVVAELGGPGQAFATHYDLRDFDSIETAVSEVEAEFGGIDVLIANAHWFTWGEAADTPYFEDMPPHTETGWVNKIRANVDGHMLTVQRAVKGMRARGWGRIVLLSSITAYHGSVGSEYYGAARAAMHGFVRGLMWSGNGVLANVVAPGATRTEFFESLLDNDATKAMADKEIEHTPSGRLSDPDDIARLILFLASEANGNVNGEVIHSAGGR